MPKNAIYRSTQDSVLANGHGVVVGNTTAEIKGIALRRQSVNGSPVSAVGAGVVVVLFVAVLAGKFR